MREGGKYEIFLRDEIFLRKEISWKKPKEEKMSDTKKPTYEEKLEALRESIKHWEDDIVPDPIGGDCRGEACPLCKLYEEKDDCGDCPIKIADKECSCDGTLWRKFTLDKTKENALAFVVFMKNLLIEMLDTVRDKSECREPKKKEEWVDITDELECRFEETKYGVSIYVYHGSEDLYYVQPTEGLKETFNLSCSHTLRDNYQIKFDGQFFRILKKT